MLQNVLFSHFPIVTSREGRVSRNPELIHVHSESVPVTSREGRVSRNPLGLHETAEEDKSRPARDV